MLVIIVMVMMNMVICFRYGDDDGGDAFSGDG